MVSTSLIANPVPSHKALDAKHPLEQQGYRGMAGAGETPCEGTDPEKGRLCAA